MGRLIDEDDVKRRMHETMDYHDLYLPVHFEMCMNDAPTVEPASPWHRVEDGLPKEEKRYFVWEADGYAFCDTWKEGKWKIGSDVPGTHITHWMPLPEPPKEDA